MRALEAKAKTSISPPGLRLAADAIARPAASHALPSPSRPSGTLVGVSMIISGVTRVMLWLAVRKAAAVIA